MGFFEALSERARQKRSLLCVGLDPRLPEGTQDPYEAIMRENRRIVEATAPYAVAYKPNSAFYEAWGTEGMRALKDTVELIHERTSALVVLDVKRGDIGATAEAYARAAFEWLGVDAVTLAPYMGEDAARPFLAYEGKGVFVLCRTSNPSAGRFQELEVTGEPLFLRVAEEAVRWDGEVGLVVAGNNPEALSLLRERHPDVWFLAPGVGAQGGSAGDAVRAGMDAEGLGVLVVVARGIARAEDPGEAAKGVVEEIRGAQAAGRGRMGEGLKERVLKGLVEAGCFKVGDFVLKSGKRSPFYVDLRRVPSFPELFPKVISAYASLARRLEFERIAGIPTAGLPIAAGLALHLGKPLIYPRLDAKGYGTGNRVEGEWRPGERVLLVDDLITTGGSKIEAATVLRDAGLVVEDLVVLLERGARGHKEMEEAGIRLHAYAHIREFLPVCRAMGLITEGEEERMRAFVEET
ncbi:orotidine-5'-phosphate decarboxylase [Spirochaeta thermophila]|uniref:Orotate phosphoribosyltransferase n=1 Tax=Winmispira thermophila (strain ATCC 49972 / DSM 6192 / RI 19.B1) TaxID=665571 RepID=E0RTI4_WINT6|nr:orotidine-5'-phosphate decarboxylase [Spirochaeta thermophila]ADN02215.1 hypothetical protein STHERM_c12740 [Spirochaeta thermophila DSM 6192]